MSLSLKTLKMLWGRSGNRCALCRRELVADATHADDPALLGEVCHIVAREPDGPRGASPLTPEARDYYENLVLLCGTDHKLVDTQVNTYTVESLVALRSAHEAWVRSSLSGYDPTLQEADEHYAAIVSEWETRLDVSHWQAWSSNLLSPQPSMAATRYAAWDEARIWLLNRVWPERRQLLEDAFLNFRLVLEDLFVLLQEHFVPILGGEKLITEKFYHLDHWDKQLYDELFQQFEQHVDNVHDLTRELTRAANYVAHATRQCLSSSYRLKEGAFLAESGPNGPRGAFDIERLEYPIAKRSGVPYSRR